MEFVPIVAMMALVWKIVDLVKYVTNRDTNAIVTQLVTWAAGIAVVMLYAQTVWADGISIGNQALSALNVASQIAVGLAVAATGSVLFDAKKALDNGDNARTPSLLPEPAYTPTHADPPAGGGM